MESSKHFDFVEKSSEGHDFNLCQAEELDTDSLSDGASVKVYSDIDESSFEVSTTTSANLSEASISDDSESHRSYSSEEFTNNSYDSDGEEISLKSLESFESSVSNREPSPHFERSSVFNDLRRILDVDPNYYDDCMAKTFTRQEDFQSSLEIALVVNDQNKPAKRKAAGLSPRD